MMESISEIGMDLIFIEEKIASYKTAIRVTEDLMLVYINEDNLSPEQKSNLVRDCRVNRDCLEYLIWFLQEELQEFSK